MFYLHALKSSLGKFIFGGGACLLQLYYSGTAVATSVNHSNFFYDGLELVLGGGAGAIVANWNPRNDALDHNAQIPGVHISFFGNGMGCDEQASNGPVVPLPPNFRRLALRLTGVNVTSSNPQTWTPTADKNLCGIDAGLEPGPAFVVADGSPNGGLGLFTHIGSLGPTGMHHFWHQFGVSGQAGTKANTGIEGTFVQWLFSWRNGDSMYPWSGNARPESDNLRVVIESTQSVYVTNVSTAPPGTKPNQAKQQFAVHFVNISCKPTAPPRLCQLKYLFHTVLLRHQASDWVGQSWADKGILRFDRAQEGIPIIFGPLKPASQITFSAAIPTLGLWTSKGDPTQRSPIIDHHFEAEISFPTFCETLRFIAGQALHLSLKPRDADVARVFGEDWRNPRVWILADANVGQEVHTAISGAEVSIGGRIREFGVRAMP